MTMIATDHPEHELDMPRAGVAARRLSRFEGQLAEWLETSEGRFACFYAARACSDPSACATCEHHPKNRLPAARDARG